MSRDDSGEVGAGWGQTVTLWAGGHERQHMRQCTQAPGVVWCACVHVLWGACIGCGRHWLPGRQRVIGPAVFGLHGMDG